MKNYEILAILKPNFDSDETEKVNKEIEGIITSLDGKVDSIDKIGRKKLAYDINNYRDGIYVTFNVQLDPSKLKEMQRQFKLYENLLRTMVLEAQKVKVESK